MRYIILTLMTMILCSGSENIIILGSVSVPLDPQWTIIGHKSSGPIRVIALQIPNVADEGTSESTNLSVSIYDVTDIQGMLTFSNTMLAIKDAKEDAHKNWKLMTWSGMQNGIKYSILDAVFEDKNVKSTIHTRMAFPLLPNNEKDYELKLKNRTLLLLDSIKINVL